jgi:hypothetical protein
MPSKHLRLLGGPLRDQGRRKGRSRRRKHLGRVSNFRESYPAFGRRVACRFVGDRGGDASATDLGFTLREGINLSNLWMHFRVADIELFYLKANLGLC